MVVFPLFPRCAALFLSLTLSIPRAYTFGVAEKEVQESRRAGLLT
jgi:hypothetical protein